MSRKRSVLLAAAVMMLSLAATPALAGDTATYQVTITNNTASQWFTPPAVATHDGLDVFTRGQVASEGVKEIAENGNLAPLIAMFQASESVTAWTVAIANPALPPLAPGESVTVMIDAEYDDTLSFVAMLICTNDGFTGIDGLRLPREVGQTMMRQLLAYDAGTEMNTEAWADLVPPCAHLTGFGDQGGTGASDPALAESSIITRHRGIQGTADLVPSIHGWHGPVATIEVTKLG
jgi:hypothetical protein